MSTEIELKLSLPLNGVAPLQRNPLLKSLSISSPVNRKLYSIYYDTPDLDLRRNGVAFRLRREGRRWMQALKVEAAPRRDCISARSLKSGIESATRLHQNFRSSLAGLFDVAYPARAIASCIYHRVHA